jgi:lipopolysaccharide exporter
VTTPPDRVSPAELRAAALAGVRWFTVARLGVEIAAFSSSVVLARLIPPAEFGRAAVGLFVVVMAGVIPSQGLSVPLVQRREVGDRVLETAALTALLAGLVLGAAVFLLAPVVVAPLLGSRIAELVRIASPAFLLAAFGAVPEALLSRRLNFKSLSIAELASVALGAATAVALAVAGVDAEAIVLGAIVTVGVQAALFLAFAPRVVPRWHRGAFGELGRFGALAALSSYAYTAFRSVDYAILAARVRPAQVGYYWRAYQVAVDYQLKVSMIMLRIAFPLYARSGGLEQTRRLRIRIVRLHTVVVFPLLATLIAVAPKLVPLVFGESWQGAVEPTQILAVAGMAVAVGMGAGPLVMAAGAPGKLLAYNASCLAAYSTLVALTAPYGITTVCVAVALFQLAAVLAQVMVVERSVGIPPREVGAALLPAGAGSLAALAVAYPLAAWLSTVDLPRAAFVVAVGAAAALVYGTLLRLAFPAAWADVKLIGGAFMRRSPGETDPPRDEVGSAVGQA